MFEEIIKRGVETGILIILPSLLLLFTIVYAILIKTKILGENKSVNSIFALVLTLLVIVADITTKEFRFIKFVSYLMPYTSLIIIGILAWALLVGMVGLEIDWKAFLAAFIFLELIIPDTFLVFLFLEKTGQTIPGWLGFFEGPVFKLASIGIAVFLVVAWFITRDKVS